MAGSGRGWSCRPVGPRRAKRWGRDPKPDAIVASRSHGQSQSDFTFIMINVKNVFWAVQVLWTTPPPPTTPAPAVRCPTARRSRNRISEGRAPRVPGWGRSSFPNGASCNSALRNFSQAASNLNDCSAEGSARGHSEGRHRRPRSRSPWRTVGLAQCRQAGTMQQKHNAMTLSRRDAK